MRKKTKTTCPEFTTWKQPGGLVTVPCVVEGDHDEHHFVHESGADLGKRKAKREEPKETE